MQIILVKLTLYVIQNAKKNKHFTVLFHGKTPLEFKKRSKNQTIFIPYLLQAQPALVVINSFWLHFTTFTEMPSLW